MRRRYFRGNIAEGNVDYVFGVGVDATPEADESAPTPVILGFVSQAHLSVCGVAYQTRALRPSIFLISVYWIVLEGPARLRVG